MTCFITSAKVITPGSPHLRGVCHFGSPTLTRLRPWLRRLWHIPGAHRQIMVLACLSRPLLPLLSLFPPPLLSRPLLPLLSLSSPPEQTSPSPPPPVLSSPPEQTSDRLSRPLSSPHSVRPTPHTMSTSEMQSTVPSSLPIGFDVSFLPSRQFLSLLVFSIFWHFFANAARLL